MAIILLNHISEVDSKIVEEIQHWTERVKRLHFLSENGRTLIAPNGDVCGNLSDDASLMDLYRSSQSDPDSIPKSKNLNCYAVCSELMLTDKWVIAFI